MNNKFERDGVVPSQGLKTLASKGHVLLRFVLLFRKKTSLESLFCLPLLLNGAAELGSALGSVSGWPGPLWVKYEWRHFSRNKGSFSFFGPLGNNTYTLSRFRDPVYKVHV